MVNSSLPDRIFPLSILHSCCCCPRACGVNRLAGEPGYCRTGAGFSVGSICRHGGEEPVLAGPAGMANVFFTRCNLQCRFCQNYQISRNCGTMIEHELSLDDIVRRITAILDQGARCVGFVSPSHVLCQMESIMLALRQAGRDPVFVYNSNGYDAVASLKALDGRMQVYLPDLKYLDSALARRYSDAPDYPAAAALALKEMFGQKGPDLVLDPDGMIESGLIIRHLVLPGQVENSKQVLRFIARELSPQVHVSLMAQYAPVPAVTQDPELGRPLRSEEYEQVLEELDCLGMENGWVQALDSRDYYAPDFRQAHPFEMTEHSA